MTTTAAATTFEIDYIYIIDELSAAGYCPADDFDEDGHTYNTSPTVAYFADRGWDAVRVLPDYIQFARFDDEGFALMMTNHNGCISSESKSNDSCVNSVKKPNFVI